MNLLYALATAILCGAGLYLMLSRNLVRMALGVSLLSAAINLMILQAGRLGASLPPLVEAGAETLAAGTANPVPQALVLTAIVIGLALVALMAALVLAAWITFGTLDTRAMGAAEPAAGAKVGAEPKAAPGEPVGP